MDAPSDKTLAINGTPPALLSFADNLLIEVGIESLDARTVAAMKADIIASLQDVTNRVVVESLSEQDLTKFEQMLDNNVAAEDLLNFAETQIPDLAQRLIDAYYKFRKLYLGL